MREVHPCSGCHRQLETAAFGQVTDNNEIVFVRDPFCTDCRAFQRALVDLIVEARIAVGRAESRAPLPTWAVAEATEWVRTFFAAYPEQPQPFVIDLLARLSLLHVEDGAIEREVPAYLATHLPKPVA